MGKLVLFRADGTAQDIKLDRERVTIGRRPDNDVCLPQAPVSGEHAAVVTILEDSFLEDLGSTNGTLVNGKAVTKHFLRDRDEIDIGREILVYLADDSAKIDMLPRRREAREPRSGKERAPRDADRPAAVRSARRSDVPSISGQSVDAIQRVVAEEIESSAAEEPPQAAPRSAQAVAPHGFAAHPSRPVQSIRVRSGAMAGRTIALREGETVIGRAGVQVVALRRSADELLVVPIEGATPARINGMPLPADGQRFAPGDMLEIAGATLEIVPLSEVSS